MTKRNQILIFILMSILGSAFSGCAFTSRIASFPKTLSVAGESGSPTIASEPIYELAIRYMFYVAADWLRSCRLQELKGIEKVCWLAIEDEHFRYVDPPETLIKRLNDLGVEIRPDSICRGRVAPHRRPFMSVNITHWVSTTRAIFSCYIDTDELHPLHLQAYVEWKDGRWVIDEDTVSVGMI